MPFDIPEFIPPMPEFDIPKEMVFNLDKVEVGKKINASIGFEVVEKDENSVVIAIDNILFKNRSKRVS